MTRRALQPRAPGAVWTWVTRPNSLLLPLVPLALAAAAAAGEVRSFPLDRPDGLLGVGVTIEAAEHRGQAALRVRGVTGFEGHQLVILPGSSLRDGVIEARIAGQPAEGATAAARGFVGIAFRVAAKGERFECFYLRPTNGRADDQLRRNHSTQYIAHPGFPWHELRKQFPGVYESYVDLVPGEWTDVRIEVAGTKARLFVHGADQPALIVDDLKLGEGAAGDVALWIGEGTEAWFRDVRIAPSAAP